MKKLISIFLVVMLFCSVIPAAYADSSVSDNETGISQDESTIEPRVEETDWIFRYNSELGIYEKRLWSYTYGKWLTDWMPALP